MKAPSVRRLVGVALGLAVTLLASGLYLRSHPVPILAALMPTAWRSVSPGQQRSNVYLACGHPEIPWGDIKGDAWFKSTPIGRWELAVFYVDGGALVRDSYVVFHLGSPQHSLRLLVR